MDPHEPICIICLTSLPIAPPQSSDNTSQAASADVDPLFDDADQGSNVVEKPADVAHLQNCRHSSHDHCLADWIEVANTCPACRATFNQVDISNTVNGRILHSYPVVDKIQAVPDNGEGTNIDYEYVDDDSAAASQRWHCIICGRTDQPEVLLLCDECDDAYHTHCLGLEGVPDGDWYCPTCLVYSEYMDRHIARSRSDFVDEESQSRMHVGRRARTVRPTPRNTRISRPRARRQVNGSTRQQQWNRAWETLRNRRWQALEADIEGEGGETLSVRDIERLQREEGERQKWIARMSRTTANNRQPLPVSNSADLSSEDERAWTMFDEAKGNVKRKTEKVTRGESKRENRRPNLPNGMDVEVTGAEKPTSSSPIGGGSHRTTPRTSSRSIPQQGERKLKRPRTRRDITPMAIPPSIAPQDTSASASGSDDDRRGSFLQGLLANINRPKTPPTTLDFPPHMKRLYPENLAGLSPPHSPSLSPAASNGTSTPPLPLSPASMVLPPRISPSPPPLVAQPTITIHPSQSSPPRHPPPLARGSSPTFAQKAQIERLVSNVLKPYYRKGDVNKDEFTEINKGICRRLYGEEKVSEDLVGTMVETEVERLRGQRRETV